MRTLVLIARAALLAVPLGACPELGGHGTSPAASHAPVSTTAEQAGVHRRYGAPVRLGNGRARSYLAVVPANGGTPFEIGFALDERALDGLPTDGSGHHGSGEPVHEYVLPLPAPNPTPYRALVINWNPGGHEPPGIYDAPHFDFHFYTITLAERDAIVASDPQFEARANHLPAGVYVPPFTAVAAPPGMPPVSVAVEKMGVHWNDMRSPELQEMLGNPAGYRPFSATWVLGSWDGRFIFFEPMITRAHLLATRDASEPAQRDQVIPIPLPARYAEPGYYPQAYRITYDERAREYRIALTNLVAGE